MQKRIDFTRICKCNKVGSREFINVVVGLGVKMKSKSVASLLGLHDGAKGRSIVTTQFGSTSTIRSA